MGRKDRREAEKPVRWPQDYQLDEAFARWLAVLPAHTSQVYEGGRWKVEGGRVRQTRTLRSRCRGCADDAIHAIPWVHEDQQQQP